MGELGELYVVLVAIQLLESTMWVPRGRVAFGGGWSRRQIGAGLPVLGEARRGLMLLSPWPPLAGGYLSARLLEASDLGADARDAEAMRAALAQAFDVEAIVRRRDALFARTRALRVVTHLLFAQLFVVAPAVAFVPGLGVGWVPWLVALVVLLVAVEVTFVRAHRALFPEAREQRWTRALSLVSPPAAVRALDALTAPLLERFHPLALARVVAPREVFAAMTSDAMRRLVHPVPAAEASTDPFAIALREAIERFASAEGLDAAIWSGPPARREPSSQAYCRRCLVEFAKLDAVCDDCGGLSVEAYAGTRLE